MTPPSATPFCVAAFSGFPQPYGNTIFGSFALGL